MNATQAARLKQLESCLATVAGAPVTITIRDISRFTWSLDERNDAAADRLVAFVKDCPSYAGANVETFHDDECGSFVYVEVAA